MTERALKLSSERQLIAPCGMFCGICSSYLAWKNNLLKIKGKIHHCQGCRPRGKICALLKGNCPGIRENRFQYCYECPVFPCQHLKSLDKRYRIRYSMSMIDNLLLIKEKGEKVLLEEIYKKYQCLHCHNLRSIHNGKCFECEEVKSWKQDD